MVVSAWPISTRSELGRTPRTRSALMTILKMGA